MKSSSNILHLLRKIEGTQTSGTEVQIEATGVLKAITQHSFQFIACMAHQILSLLDRPNTLLQARATDLHPGVRLVQSALVCVEDSQFDTRWEKFTGVRPQNFLQPLHRNDKEKLATRETKWSIKKLVRKKCESLTDCKRLYFSILDAAVGETPTRFSERNNQPVEAMCALHPGI